MMKLFKLRKQANSTRKIKIVAIAKDEAPYFSHWVYHHLHFGFDAISIYINRTTDNSTDVLNAIVQADERVQWHSADWVDYLGDHVRTHLQSIVYSAAYQQAMDEGFSHVLFIDIDEYWIPKDFTTSIHHFLDDFHPESSVSFQWLCENGGMSQPFDVFPATLTGVNTVQVKTLVNKCSGIRRMGIHIPIFVDGSKHFFADGTRFVRAKQENEQSDIAHVGMKNAFILHRLYRSEMEYVVSLTRGIPNEVNKWKSNRAGFVTSHPNQETVSLPSGAYERYCNQYTVWRDSLGIEQQENMAKNFIVNKYKDALNTLASPDGQALKQAPMLRGVNLENTVRLAEKSK